MLPLLFKKNCDVPRMSWFSFQINSPRCSEFSNSFFKLKVAAVFLGVMLCSTNVFAQNNGQQQKTCPITKVSFHVFEDKDNGFKAACFKANTGQLKKGGGEKDAYENPRFCLYREIETVTIEEQTEKKIEWYRDDNDPSRSNHFKNDTQYEREGVLSSSHNFFTSLLIDTKATKKKEEVFSNKSICRVSNLTGISLLNTSIEIKTSEDDFNWYESGDSNKGSKNTLSLFLTQTLKGLIDQNVSQNGTVKYSYVQNGTFDIALYWHDIKVLSVSILKSDQSSKQTGLNESLYLKKSLVRTFLENDEQNSLTPTSNFQNNIESTAKPSPASQNPVPTKGSVPASNNGTTTKSGAPPPSTQERGSGPASNDVTTTKSGAPPPPTQERSSDISDDVILVIALLVAILILVLIVAIIRTFFEKKMEPAQDKEAPSLLADFYTEILSKVNEKLEKNHEELKQIFNEKIVVSAKPISHEPNKITTEFENTTQQPQQQFRSRLDDINDNIIKLSEELKHIKANNVKENKNKVNNDVNSEGKSGEGRVIRKAGAIPPINIPALNDDVIEKSNAEKQQPLDNPPTAMVLSKNMEDTTGFDIAVRNTFKTGYLEHIGFEKPKLFVGLVVQSVLLVKHVNEQKDLPPGISRATEKLESLTAFKIFQAYQNDQTLDDFDNYTQNTWSDEFEQYCIRAAIQQSHLYKVLGWALCQDDWSNEFKVNVQRQLKQLLSIEAFIPENGSSFDINTHSKTPGNDSSQKIAKVHSAGFFYNQPNGNQELKFKALVELE